jgi:poly(3-hydroxybutyrate) depolymerase
MSSDETVEYWRKLAGCREHEQINIESGNADDTYIEKRTWKKNGIMYVVQFIVHGGGHSIPHEHITFPKILGATNHDITFVKETWSFFSQV